MFRTEDGAIVGSINVAELTAEEKVALGFTSEDEATEDLSKLLKADLVAKAEAAGLDVDGLKKDEIVELLEDGDG